MSGASGIAFWGWMWVSCFVCLVGFSVSGFGRTAVVVCCLLFVVCCLLFVVGSRDHDVQAVEPEYGAEAGLVFRVCRPEPYPLLPTDETREGGVPQSAAGMKT